MQDKDISVIGAAGYVGKGMLKMFPAAIKYDPPAKLEASQEDVNKTKLAIICLPTPTAEDGWSCDTSIVESVFEWLKVPLVLIKSTVTPGTTDKLRVGTGLGVCMSPEYMGMGGYYTPPQYPDPKDPTKHGFMIVGGASPDTKKIVDIFITRMGPHTKFMQTDAKTAEVIKLMENCWGAQKVTFANEMYNCCEALGVDYRTVREGFLMDPRTEPMHTAVFTEKRGYGGHCYPKDVRNLVKSVEDAGYDPKFLKGIINSNNRIRKSSGLEDV